MFKIGVLLVTLMIVLSSCYVPQRYRTNDEDKEISKDVSENIMTSQSVVIPKDKYSTPIPGEMTLSNPDTILYITEIGQMFEVKFGQEVNFIYSDGIDPDATYFSYESTYDGYILELRERNDPIDIVFTRLCQIHIVASPNLTYVNVPDDLKYEQIIWTPRKDGTWEVRIGTTERGCKSKALRDLQKLRTGEYEKSIPR